MWRSPAAIAVAPQQAAPHLRRPSVHSNPHAAAAPSRRHAAWPPGGTATLQASHAVPQWFVSSGVQTPPQTT